MGNTIIIKEDGRAMNSDIHSNYSIVITEFSRIEKPEDPGDLATPLPPTIKLRAMAKPKAGDGATRETVLISTFYELEEACEALKALVLAFESEKELFDVRDYNSKV